ncbi:MAG: hypothetical protein KGR26_06140, partial [Cyanobacteria bacterium REEB65]|nr:hypothetical protein [Cyanobacteria bacterium REEB65]
MFVAYDMKAAADLLGPGPVRMPEIEQEIYDRQRRTYPIADRIYKRPATGHPTLYVEQTGIGRGSFSDPRNISPTRVNHPRDQKSAMIKAIVSQFTVSLFDSLANQMKTQN